MPLGCIQENKDRNPQEITRRRGSSSRWAASRRTRIETRPAPLRTPAIDLPLGCIQENKDRNRMAACAAAIRLAPLGCIQENKDRNSSAASASAATSEAVG